MLDCDAATLTVWVNGERKGVMVQPGMTDAFGGPVARLEGPLRWAAEIYAYAVEHDDEEPFSIAIAGPLPLPN